MRKQYLTITTAVLAVTLLAGCSGGGTAADGSGDTKASGGASTGTDSRSEQAAPAQTKQEACTLLEDELKSFIADQMSSSAPADPKARAEVVDGFTDRLEQALPKVGNEQVKSDFTTFTKAAEDYADALERSGSATSDAAQQAETKVQDSLAAISADCPAS
ncbi:hypothetical protein ABC270_17075 [Curtobacterium sp. 1P10AnD]|uniref:hypothetical protein n=1 Tax=Curtobacterium sp. 1P10AnD TaxID=3132283 RepID=UPI0039A34A30